MSNDKNKSKDKGLKKYVIVSASLSIAIIIGLVVFDYSVEYEEPVDEMVTSDQVRLTVTKMKSDMVEIFQKQQNINQKIIMDDCKLSVDYGKDNMMVTIIDCPILNFNYNIINDILTNEIDVTWCDGQLIKTYGKYDLKNEFKEVYTCEK